MALETKTCQNCKANFIIEEADFAFYKKIDVPVPTRCPDCRRQNRMLFRNFKTLYKRKSDKSQKSLISMYSDKVPFPVYEHAEWYSDNWDARSYGKDFDFSRPFFEQFKELLDVVPRFSLMNTKSERCEYANMTYGSTDCYLVFGCVDDEDCAYGHIVWECKDCYDGLYLYKCELCYECVDCLESYRLMYCQECEACTDSIGCFDCRGCTNSIGCVGLKQKNYHIFNKAVSKDEYQKFLVEHPLSDPRTITLVLRKQEELRRNVPQRHFFGTHNTNVTGNHIYNARNMFHSFDVKGGEDSKYIYTMRKPLDTHDASFSIELEQGYQVITCRGARAFFSHLCQDSHDIYYSDTCFGSGNLFGCAGLRSKEYCILNKQNSKEEYFPLKEKIVEYMRKTGEYGEFFPKELSPFAYNESIVNEYMPLAKEEALVQGFRWEDDIPATKGQETLSHDELPMNPKDYTLELTKQVLKCDACARNYRLIQPEVELYKQLGVSIPRQCFNCRHERRMRMRNQRKLWPGVCAKCGAEFETSYSPEQQKEFKIYCETCYNKEMV